MAKRSGTPTEVRAARVASAKKRVKRASQLPKHARFLIYGRSGAGKTRLAATAPKVLLVDVNEQGWDSTRGDLDPHTFPVERWQDLNDVYWWLASGDHPFESVAVDGVTAMQNLCMKFVLGDEASRDASRDPDMPSRQVWGKVGELMKTQITNFRNLPMNVVFTALTRTRIVGEEDDDSEEMITGPACSPSIAGHLEAAVGLIGFLQARRVVVTKEDKKGKSKKVRVVKRRLTVDGSDRFLTKDRYHLGSAYIDSPNIKTILEIMYGRNDG